MDDALARLRTLATHYEPELVVPRPPPRLIPSNTPEALRPLEMEGKCLRKHLSWWMLIIIPVLIYIGICIGCNI